MGNKRKSYTPAFKAQAALAAVKGDRTVNELAGPFGVHPTLLQSCQRQLLQGAESVFANGVKLDASEQARSAELFEPIGRLKMELEWRKKNNDPIRR